MSVLEELARASRQYTVAEPGSTRARLVDTAERLFADRGIEGVSLRTISTEAGQANTRALQYHFDDRNGIINAIVLTRMVQLDARRALLLDEAVANGRLDLIDILDVLLRPVSEMVDASGSNVYARFLSHIMIHTFWWTQCHAADTFIPAPGGEKTGTERAHDKLKAALPFLTTERISARMSNILRMFTGAIIDRENTAKDGGAVELLEDTIAEQLEMAAAALRAPMRSR